MAQRGSVSETPAADATRETKPVATCSLGYEYPRLGLFNNHVSTGGACIRRLQEFTDDRQSQTVQPLPIAMRPATPADVDEIVRIYVDSWNAGFGKLLSPADRTVTPDLVERWTRDLALPVPHRLWVAERQGSIVGFVGIRPSRDPVDPRLGEIDTIAVEPGHWRTGVGTALMSLALRYLLSDGYSDAIVWTVEGYKRGIAFYETMGWRRDGGVRDEGRQMRFSRSMAISPVCVSCASVATS